MKQVPWKRQFEKNTITFIIIEKIKKIQLLFFKGRGVFCCLYMRFGGSTQHEDL